MAAPARAAAGVRVALAGLTALAVPMGIGRFAFTPIVPMMQVDAGLSLATAVWLASANYLGTLVGALAAMTVTMPLQPAWSASIMIAALASAFAVGQIAGPVVVRLAIGTDRAFSVALVLACAELVASAGALMWRRDSPRP